MNFVLTCGGTAGHINPALAVAGRLRELMPDCGILFIGAEGKMEMELVPREGYDIRPLKITNISRGKNLAAIKHNIETVKNVFVSTKEAKTILRDFAPDAVIGTGGYVCYPVIKAAASMGIPTAIHESNAVPGLTTKLLSGHVDRVMVGFEESKDAYGAVGSVTVTGTPVRGAFGRYTKERAKAELGIEQDKPLVLSVWGSLGAGRMNQIVSEMLPLMNGQNDFNLIHAAGKQYYAKLIEDLGSTREALRACRADIREYIYDMPRVMAAADLILCRAGASTISELTFLGKPTLFVPSPNVTNNHQERNARVLEAAGGAKVLLESELDAKGLLEAIRSLLRERDTLSKMSEAMNSLAVKDATDRICSVILDMLQK